MRTLIPPLTSLSLTPPGQDAAYIFTLTLTSSHLAALTSSSTLYLLSPTTLRPHTTLRTPHTLLTALSPSTLSPSTLATAGASPHITLHDPRTPHPALTITTPFPTASLASSPSGLLAAGSELTDYQSWVSVYDPRSPAAPSRCYKDSHNDDVTALSFSPCSSLLASGGTDGLLNIFSLSAPAGGKGEGDDEVDGAVRAVVQHGSVQKCGFLEGGEVWGLSHDEVIAVYEDGGLGETRAVGDARGVTGAEYFVDVLPRGRDAWVVGGNKVEGWVDLVALTRVGRWEEGVGGYRLQGGHGEELCRSLVVDQMTNTIFTGGEDGIVKAWRPPVETQVKVEVKEEMEVEAAETREERRERKRVKEEMEVEGVAETKEERRERRRAKKEKKERKEKKDKERFKPY